MKKIKYLSSVSILPLLLFSCASSLSKEGKWIKYSVMSYITASDYSTVKPFAADMTLRYFISNSIKNPDSFEETLTSTFEKDVKYYHYIFDRHHYYYNNEEKTSYYTSLKTINDSYGTNKEVVCPKELYDLLKEGVRYTELTSGYFSFFSGRLVDFWDEILTECSDNVPYTLLDPLFNEENNELLKRLVYTTPTVEEAKHLLTFNDEKCSVIFNTLENIYYNDELLERDSASSLYRPLITAGAIAKGYATKLIQDDLISKNYTSGFLNSGSSSISHLSKPNYTKKNYQEITFADPRNLYVRVGAFKFNIYDKVNLSTSGNYSSKSYEMMINDQKIRRHHIINPYSGEPEQLHESITLVSKSFDAGQLDAFSTALLCQSEQDILAFRKKVLSEFPSFDLDIIILDLDSDKETLLIKSTSTFSSSLKVVEDCAKAKVIYFE